MKRTHRTIYLKETTINLEKELEKMGFNLNYSDIYEEALKRKICEVNQDLGSFFKQKMAENKQKMAENKQKMRFFEQKLRDFESKKQAELTKKIKTTKEKEEKDNENMKIFSEHIKDFFGLTDKNQISELAQNFTFIRNQQPSITLFEFMESKGIKPLEEIPV